MYRPPNVNARTFLGCYNSILCQMKKENPKTIIIGLDHNMDFLKSAEHALTNDFIQSNLDFDLVPTITRPTRITHSLATLIDNIIVSQNLCGRYASSVLINDISDHLPTACIIPSLIASKKGPIAITSRETRPKNMKALKRQLTETNWSIELGGDSCNSNMVMLTKILTNAVDRCIPEQTRYLNPKSLRREPWLTSGLKRSIDRNKKLYGKSLRCPLTREKYKYYNNAFHKSIKKAKIDYYKEKCREYKMQTNKLWKLINEISGKRNDKSNLVAYLKIDDVQVYNAKKISNSFARYFLEVGEKFAKKIPSPTKSISEYMKVMGSNTRSIFLEPTDENEIRKIAFDLPNKSSSGHDRVSNVLLKEIIAQIAEPLSMIFNQSLQTGEFPSDMKLAEVVPLYKSKEHYLESNYRPISLLTTISKILEKVVYKRVYKFLTESSQLYDNQYGFRSNHSCEHAISQTVGNLLKNLENKKNSICVLLDLSKAFDTIEHSIMLEKLDLYGIRGTALSWFHSYLSDRHLRVKCRTTSCGIDTLSDEFTVKYGTPQGSCIGPLIFLIFVNYLHLHLSDSECVQFVDDMTLIFAHRNLKYLCFCVEQELCRIRDWFHANKLTLNIEKSSYLLFVANKVTCANFKLSLDGLEIPRVNHARFLGTWLDDKLSWDTHVSKLMAKLKCGIGMLQRSKTLLNSSAKRLLYFGQIHSNLCYCLGVWGLMLSKKTEQKSC